MQLFNLFKILMQGQMSKIATMYIQKELAHL